MSVENSFLCRPTFLKALEEVGTVMASSECFKGSHTAPTSLNKIKVVGTALTFSLKEKVGAVLTSSEPFKEGQRSKEDTTSSFSLNLLRGNEDMYLPFLYDL